MIRPRINTFLEIPDQINRFKLINRRTSRGIYRFSRLATTLKKMPPTSRGVIFKSFIIKTTDCDF